MSVIFSNIRKLALNGLKRYPIATQAVEVSLIMGTGDILAQSLVEKVQLDSLNWKRTAQFSFLGLFLVGPSLRFWYGKLDRIVATNQSAWKRTLKKVSLDQLAFAPIFAGIFTVSISALQGLNGDEIVTRLKKDYFSILTTNYMIWPAAQAINFSLIPLNYQVIFVQCVAIFWNMYLSIKLGRQNKEAA